MSRWFHLVGVVWLASLAIILFGELSAPVISVGGGVLFAVVLLLGRRRLPLWLFASVAAVSLCAGWLAVYTAIWISPVQYDEQQTAFAYAAVTDREISGNTNMVTLRLQKGTEPARLEGVRVRLRVPVGVDIAPGDVVKCTIQLTCEPQERARLYADGYRFAASIYYQPEIIGRCRSLEISLSEHRAGLRGNLIRLLPNGEGELLAAMLTGQTGGILPDTREQYARAGISHLLAVSGLHLSILTMLLGALLQILRVPKRVRIPLEMLLVLVFMALTGFPFSVMRAGMMLLLSRTAMLLGREADSLNSLGIAMVVILLINPYAAQDIGLQLSYLATMGIILFTDPLTNLCTHLFWKLPLEQARGAHKNAVSLIGGGCVTLGANILTTPLICYYFGQLSLVSVFVNLAIFPITTIALSGAAICAALGYWPALMIPYRLSGLIAGSAMKLIDRIAIFFGSWEFAAIPMREGYQLIWLVVTTGVLILLWYCKSGWKAMLWTAQLSVCALLIGAVSFSVMTQDRVQVAAVRGGEAVVVIYGRQTFIVGMPESTYEMRNVGKLLEDQGVDSIDLLIVNKEQQLTQSRAVQWLQKFPARQTIVLNQLESAQVMLYDGRIQLKFEQTMQDALSIQIGAYTIVKDFSMRWLSADLLINQRNEIIFTQGLHMKSDERYYGANLLSFSVAENQRGEDA